MAKNRIFTVGFEFPGAEFEYVNFDSDTTLLDADIVLFEPTLGLASGYQNYNGKTLLDDHSSFSAKQRLDHWRAEIVTAVKAGKLVVVYLTRPKECFRSTGEKKHSGTGRSMVTTNIVTEISSYEAIPGIKSVSAKSGSEMQLHRDARVFAPYWTEFESLTSYEVEIEGDFKHILLKSRSGERVLGAMIKNIGALLLIPPIKYDEKKFLKNRNGSSYWTSEAMQFGKRMVSVLGALAQVLRESGSATPPPGWISESQYRLEAEGAIEVRIAANVQAQVSLQSEKAELDIALLEAGSLRNLLFEQGKLLEMAVLESLRLLGFNAESFANGQSEFDAVFSSEEGRCLGEAEGKETKAINIDKMSQLERNIQEDFARDEVSVHAKGVLFGNAFRLLPLPERGEYFTEKCRLAARRVGVALVRTPDLFEAARHLKANPDDVVFAKRCREAIFLASGEVVTFPEVRSNVSAAALTELHKSQDVVTLQLTEGKE